MNTTAVKSTSVRFSADVFEFIKKKAKAERRSISNYLNCLVAKAMEEDEEYVDEALMKDIARARKEYEEGKTHSMLEGETLDEFLRRMGHV